MPGHRNAEWLDPQISAYIDAHTTAADEVLDALQERTRAEVPDYAGMQIGADQGSLLTALTLATRTSSAVEIGTFTGYSSVCIARGLQPGGRLICCDVSDEWTAIARDAWRQAGVEDRVELRLGPALDTLRALPDEPIDLAFIDADKPGYAGYWEELLPRMRPGGLILVDNTLWSGQVVGTEASDPNTEALRAFNDLVAADARVITTILPVGDGVTVATVRP